MRRDIQMSEVLTINTESNLYEPKVERIEPLPLYDDTSHFLKMEMPIYEGDLPNPEMTELVQRLKFTMKQFGGVGLSANQCGVLQRVFVMGQNDVFVVCINPKIIDHSENIVRDREGCLSSPGLFFNVPRYEWITAEYQDNTGKTYQVKFEGLTARIYQHELDHMNGIHYTEHVGGATLMMAKKKQAKLIRNVKKNKSNGLYVQP